VNRIWSSFFAVAVLITSLPVFGGVAGWSDYASVIELTPTDQQRYQFRIRLKENPGGCKNIDTFYQDYDQPGSDKVFNVLLQAVISDKKVRVYMTGRCELKGYSEISAVTIAP
jgi:hypothetical protein